MSPNQKEEKFLIEMPEQEFENEQQEFEPHQIESDGETTQEEKEDEEDNIFPCILIPGNAGDLTTEYFKNLWNSFDLLLEFLTIDDTKRAMIPITALVLELQNIHRECIDLHREQLKNCKTTSDVRKILTPLEIATRYKQQDNALFLILTDEEENQFEDAILSQTLQYETVCNTDMFYITSFQTNDFNYHDPTIFSREAKKPRLNLSSVKQPFIRWHRLKVKIQDDLCLFPKLGFHRLNTRWMENAYYFSRILDPYINEQHFVSFLNDYKSFFDKPHYDFQKDLTLKEKVCWNTNTLNHLRKMTVHQYQTIIHLHVTHKEKLSKSFSKQYERIILRASITLGNPFTSVEENHPCYEFSKKIDRFLNL